MDPEDVLNLFDSCWFNLEIFNNNKSLSSVASKFVRNPSDQPKFSSLRPIIMRSKSDELSSMSSFNYGSNSMSPNSVLFTPQLQTILSGKESNPEEEIQQQQEQEPPKKSPVRAQEKPKRTTTRRISRSRGASKSLSELEFEELKGFMDLGFVFSEKDKESSLAEIIPGLQRLGQEKVDPKEQETASSTVKVVEKSSAASRRPYLSEAWEALEKERRRRDQKQNPLLMKWVVPSLSNEVDVKDSLKLWAHSVASVVR